MLACGACLSAEQCEFCQIWEVLRLLNEVCSQNLPFWDTKPTQVFKEAYQSVAEFHFFVIMLQLHFPGLLSIH